MKKILLYINLLILTIFNCQAQAYSLLKTIPANANAIEVDPFGNFYILEELKISKYSENGILLNVFNEMENGSITSLDVSNSLKPLVFHKDFSTLQILDQKLSVINSVNLTVRNLDFVETFAHANGDNYWVFDGLNNTLKKLNKSLNLIYESEPFSNLFTESAIPTKIIETEQNVFVLDHLGIHLFDNYANFKKTVKIPELKDIQVLGEKIIYLNENKLISYHLKTLQIEVLEIPPVSNITSAKIYKNGLLLLTEKNLYIYSQK